MKTYQKHSCKQQDEHKQNKNKDNNRNACEDDTHNGKNFTKDPAIDIGGAISAGILNYSPLRFLAFPISLKLVCVIW